MDTKTQQKIPIATLQSIRALFDPVWMFQVDNLVEGIFYEFKVQAANMAGVGLPSVPSLPMKCVAWTMEEPGSRTAFAPASVVSPGLNTSSCPMSRSSLRPEL